MLLLIGLYGCASINKAGHFIPSKDSELNIEFDYPSEWGILRETDITLHDEKGRRTLKGARILFPDPSQPEPPCVAKEIGPDYCFDFRTKILLLLWDLNLPSDWAEDQIADDLEHIESIWAGYLIEDSVIYINGLPTRMITNFSEGDELFKEEKIYIKIWFQVSGRGYFFALSYLAPEDMGGEFHQAFLDILDSIKFVDQK